MIRCPKCKAINREGSHFCNECGAPLPESTLTCPKCGAKNPASNVLCDQCNARLTPINGLVPPGKTTPSPEEEETAPPSVKGLSLPSKPRSAEKESTGTGLTGWLSSLEPDESAKSQDDSVEEEEDLPDWLAELMPEAPSEEAARATKDVSSKSEDEEELPDWLSEVLPGASAEAPDIPASEDKSSDSTDDEWLSDLLPDETTPTEPEPQPGIDLDETEEEWLADLLPETPLIPTEPEADQPEFMPEAYDVGEEEEEVPVVEEETKVPPTGEAPSADLPEWLLSLSDDFPTQREISAPELPDWLLALADEEAGVESVPSQAELPDWLIAMADTPVSSRPPAERTEEEPVARQAVSPTSSQTTEVEAEPKEESPDWLSGMAPAEAEESEELPDWLAEEAPAAEATEEPAEAVAEGELPDWLSGIPPAEAEETEELPDWLAEEAPAAEVVEEPAEAVAGGELPDWLSGMAPAEAEEAEELPDWLAEEAPAAEVVEEPAEAKVEVESADEVTEGEMPDWLSGVAPADAEIAEEELPDWLQTAAEVEMDEDALLRDETLLSDEELVKEEEDVPDWLNALPGAPAPGGIDDTLVQADVPTWLQDLRPPGTGPLPTLPEDEEGTEEAAKEAEPELDFGLPPEEKGGLERATLPDWVQGLRPTADSLDRRSTHTRGPEATGPLQGLRNLLPPAKLDLPTDVQVTKRPVIPENIVEQARLWQQILEQPRGTERIITHPRTRAGWHETVLRIVVTLVLLASILVAIFNVSRDGDPIAQTLPSPAAVDLRRMLDRQNPGDTVIIALEYRVAEALEMNPIAEVLLSHLKEQGSQVLLVSSFPEGVGIAESLASSTDITVVQPLLEPAPISTPATVTNSAVISAVSSITASTVVSPVGAITSTQSVTHSEPLTTPKAGIVWDLGEAQYLPGSASGVLNFLSMDAVQDASLLLVLSADADHLRWWVEQNEVADTSLPMGVGVSAALEPLVRPYLETHSIQGWIAGFSGMVAYRQDRGLPYSRYYSGKLDALMLAHWAAAGLLIFGTLYYVTIGKKGAV